jgi:hypothetical protein
MRDNIAKLEDHYGVQLPPGYSDWSRKKYTDYRKKNPGYLWVHEAEWIPPDEIPQRDLWRSEIITGLIPFAFSGAGDHWCWNTQVQNGEAEYDVLFCWHDEDLADRFAPTFPAWFYRNCLDYASGAIDKDKEGIEVARGHLRLWSQKLAEIHPGPWADHLAQIAKAKPAEYKHPKLRASVRMFGFITAMEVEDIVRDQFGSRYVGKKVAWGQWPT